MKRIIAAAAAAIALALTGASTAHAGTYLGPKWETGVTVSDRTADPSLEVARAVNLWQKAGAPVKMTTSTAAALITVTYAQLGDSEAAVAWVAYAGTRMVSCHIQVDEEMRGASRDIKRKVIGHELGHCVGLDHVDYHSIMSTANVTSPTNRDKTAVRALYGR